MRWNDKDKLELVARKAAELANEIPAWYQNDSSDGPPALKLNAFKGQEEFIYAVADCHHFLQRTVEKAQEAIELFPKPTYQQQ